MNRITNGSFELPDIAAGTTDSIWTVLAEVQGWHTTATDGLIELWAYGGSFSVNSFDGSQHAELNALQVSSLFQDVAGIVAGHDLTLKFAHRGRAGVDVMRVTVTDLGVDGLFGSADDSVLFAQSFSDGNTAWKSYTATGVRSLGNTIRLTFASESAAGNVAYIGNFLDAVYLGEGSPAAAPDLSSGSDSGASATDNLTSVATPVFTGTATANATVTLFNDDTAIGTGKADATGAWRITADTLATGRHLISSGFINAKGGTERTAGLTVEIDVLPPATPSRPDLIGSSDTGIQITDNATRDTTPIFYGTGEVGALVQLLDSDGATVLGSGRVSTAGSWRIASGNLADGVHIVSARQIDRAGNTGAPSAGLSVAIDTAAPAAPTAPNLQSASDTGASNADNITSFTTPSFAGRGEVGSTVTLFDGATAMGSAKVGASGTWAIKSTALAHGVHAITARATDVAGNVSAATAALSVTVDTTPPAVPTIPDLTRASDTGASNADNITSFTTPSFAGRGEVGSTVTLFDGATTIGSAKVGASGTWAIKSTALAHGVHAITARATDVAGNVSAATAALSVTVDTTPPAVPAIPVLALTSNSGVSKLDSVTSVTTPRFLGWGEVGSTVTLLDGATELGSAKVGSSGLWGVTSTTLAEGMHPIAAKATDAAGNVSAVSGAIFILIDTTPPAVPTVPDMATSSDTGASSTDNITSETNPTFVGKGDGGSTVALFDGARALGSVKVGATGSWSLRSKTLTPGVHAITANASDAAGNQSERSGALSVTVTASPPLSAGAVAPAPLGGGEASSAIALPGGGTVLLDPDVANTTVMLGSATTLILNKMRFVAAIGSDGDDVISAQGPGQTLTGGPGLDLLAGFGGSGTTFRDTAAGLDGDMIRNFGGNDIIELTDLLPGATLSYQGNASGGTLSVSDGTHAVRISLEGSYTASDFRLAGDGNGGSQIAFIRS